MFVEFTGGRAELVARLDGITKRVRERIPRALDRLVTRYHEFMKQQWDSQGAKPGPRWADNAESWLDYKRQASRFGHAPAFGERRWTRRGAVVATRDATKVLVFTGAAYDAMVKGEGEFSATVSRRGSRVTFRIGPTGEVERYMGFHVTGGRNFPARDWSVRGGQFRGTIQLSMAQSIRAVLR